MSLKCPTWSLVILIRHGGSVGKSMVSFIPWMAVAAVVQQSPRHRQISLHRIVISERSISRCRIDIDYILQAIQRWFMIDRQQSVFLK